MKPEHLRVKMPAQCAKIAQRGFLLRSLGQRCVMPARPERLRRNPSVQSVYCVKLEHLLAETPAQCAKIAQRVFLLR